MKEKRVRVLKIDNDHRIYVYPKKILYKERKNGRLITRFVGVSVNDLLDSSIISEDIRKKLEKILRNLKSFLIGV
jgi:hypothetical protein